MTLDELRQVFDEERPYHPEWPSAFALVLAPAALSLLEFYFKQPKSRRSWQHAARIRPPDIRPRPITPFKPRPLDQKQLASGEKPDDDD